MPMNGTTYVAPVWEDGKAPALNAENLNDLSKTAEGAQVLTGTSAPTTSTKGKAGQWYLNVLQKADGTYDLYQCVSVSGNTYTWKLFDSASKYIAPAVAALLGLEEGATIEDALAVLAIPPASTGAVIITCNDEDGNPVSGCVITAGDDMSVTNASGMAKFFLAPGTYSLAVRSPIDFGAKSQTKSVAVALGETVSIEATIQDSLNGATEVDFASSMTAAFSDRVVSADVFGVGAGGSGGASRTYDPNSSNRRGVATGGAGGKTATKTNIPLNAFHITVGTGGSAVSVLGDSTVKGKDGGTTTVKTTDGVTLVSAPGGNGGEGGRYASSTHTKNGANGGSGSGAVSGSTVGSGGEDGSNGGNAGAYTGGTGQGSTTRAFGEADGELFASAGGGVSGYGSVIYHGTTGEGGGAAAGAHGIDTAVATSQTAGSGQKPGCGGGGCVVIGSSSNSISGAVATSGAGANGLVRFRWEVAA